MARFEASQLRALSDKITGNDLIINRAASLAINKTLTYSKDLSVEFITKLVNLQPNYVKRNLRTAKRSSAKDLLGIVRANTRDTLLTRYPFQATNEGVRVAVNKKEGYKTIKRAFRVTNLRNSGASGIALRNSDAIEVFRSALSPSTPPKSRKLQRIINRARTKPRGITVLSSRSINQLFLDTREDVKPRSLRFMTKEFLTDVTRLQR
jgi:hypothetical protein